MMREEENVDIGTGIIICNSQVKHPYGSEEGNGPGSLADVNIVR
jgi:hypothetical protein